MIFNKLGKEEREGGMKAIRSRPEEKERRKNGRMEETETECRKNHYHIFFRQ
jgi:hypothetical protein